LRNIVSRQIGPVVTEDQITELGRAIGSGDGSLSFGDIAPSVLQDLQVPTDEVHLEVAQSGSELENVPAQPRTCLDVTVHDASLKPKSSNYVSYGVTSVGQLCALATMGVGSVKGGRT
jgi:hypothetical protein